MTYEPVIAFSLAGLTAAGLWISSPSYRAARAISIVVALALVGVTARMVVRTAGGEIGFQPFGSWAPPFGIVFVIDRLSALFATLQSLAVLASLVVLRAGTHGERTARRAYPLTFFLSMALYGAFFTGDLFNLFVMFELVLISSYLLLQVPGTKRSIRAAFPNVAINLIASLFFFVGVGILYGICGSVNMADLAKHIGEAPAGLRAAALVMLVVAFSIKAALLPVVFWLPATYPTLSGPLAALFSGMMTKLGVYALMRTAPLLMQDTLLPEVLVTVGSVSAVVGVVAALSESEIRRLFCYLIVSQVGIMIVSLGLLTEAGVAAAIFYLPHHIVVEVALFLIADELERRNATRSLEKMDFRLVKGPMLVGLFTLSAFSLAGLPPFSGFLAKIGLFHAVWVGDSLGGLIALFIASFLTLVAMLKIWWFAFQTRSKKALSARETDDAYKADPALSAAGGGNWPAGRLYPIVILVAVTLGLAAAAAPVFTYAKDAAHQLLDKGGYVEQVLTAPVPTHPGAREEAH